MSEDPYSAPNKFWGMVIEDGLSVEIDKNHKKKFHKQKQKMINKNGPDKLEKEDRDKKHDRSR